jgi:hypothetical protein
MGLGRLVGKRIAAVFLKAELPGAAEVLVSESTSSGTYRTVSARQGIKKERLCLSFFLLGCGLVLAASAATAATAGETAATATGATTASTGLLAVAITTVDWTGTAWDERNLGFFPTLCADCIVHFAACSACCTAESAASATEGRGWTRGSFGKAATATAGIAAAAGFAGASATWATFGFVGETLGCVEFLLTSGEYEGLFAIDAG